MPNNNTPVIDAINRITAFDKDGKEVFSISLCSLPDRSEEDHRFDMTAPWMEHPPYEMDSPTWQEALDEAFEVHEE